MSYLLDTCVLLRFLLSQDPNFSDIRRAVRILKIKRELIFMTAQNAAEFWNVCTRPTTARGGLEMSVSATKNRLTLLERNFPILPDSPKIYIEWKRLVENLNVIGVQVHDARLVAAMNVYRVKNLITLNAKDFSRFQNITVIEPKNIK